MSDPIETTPSTAEAGPGNHDEGPEHASIAPGDSPRPVRVGWVAGEETLDLYGRSLQPMAIGLLDELVEVVALCPAGVDVQELPSPPIEVLRYGKRRWWRLLVGATETMAAELKRRNVQMLHSLDASAWPLTRELARLTGIPCIVSSYGLDDARRLGRLEPKASSILAASEPVRGALLARHVAGADRINLIRPGVYQVRQATCFLDPSYCVSIIAGGSLDDFASFNAVITAFSRLRDRKYDCVFFILGNGKVEKRLRASAERLGIRHELTFVDRQPARSLPAIFKAADIYVSPVANRFLDVPCLLAMAGGVPVLAATEGASEFLSDRHIVTRFKACDASDLAAKLINLMDDHAEAKAVADRALGYLRTHHSPAAAVAALTAIYRTAVTP